MLRSPCSIRVLDPVLSYKKFRWPHQYCRAYFRRLSIGKKIGLGYGGALAIAMLGSMGGMAWAAHHQRLATDYAEQIRTQTETIQRLQIDVLTAQLELRSLITYTNQPDKFIATNYRLNHGLKAVANDLQQLAALPIEDQPYQKQLSTLAVDYISILNAYQQQIDQFVFNVDQILFQKQAPILSEAQQIKVSSDLLNTFLNEPAVEEFNQLPRKIGPVLRRTQNALVISQAQLAEVERYSRQVTLWSFAISTLLAATIAYCINRAITQPIQHLTFAARDSIQSANFDVQVPVKADDEIGTLTMAVNEYISGVKRLLEERQATEQKLIQAEKMSSLGQLVAGIAHEINNPINFIHGNLAHLERYTEDLFYLISTLEQQLKQCTEIDVDDIEKIKDDIDFNFLTADFPKILESLSIGSERIRTIVKGLRTFSRLDEADMKTVDIHDDLENTLLILGHRFNNALNIQVERDYGELPLIECYSGELNQVFLNILANSIDALEEAPTKQPQITIRTCHNPDKGTITICIEDNGPGIPKKIQDKIFNPFFTTKEVGKGTGLGMSISYQIITERHRGSLVCNSTLGQGAAFVMKIPARQSE
ncbi:sensor histidine kinase [Leptothoe kymatousa]|uniref:histidine kinase n=1 Tax=Leptothoe kymatousa TAU-MAC 1615 TaxID=2364775 RepID=A0ABS5Y7A7_9CYAN|nr:ATP-binding protein [Leptothoe kymatousa]MBT9313486.1 HAMP domain-containing histidine kinase [Leptothoe kymatousa TAU-MAC 1615]